MMMTTTTTSQVVESETLTSQPPPPPPPAKTSMQEQFKATKKWNEIIDSFCANMSPKRHWRNFRSYSDCFLASEAVDLVYNFLKSSSHFRHLNLTRQNAVKVLQIFVKDKLIEDVRCSTTGSDAEREFQDDDRLYRFCTNHARYMSRNVSTSNTNSLSNSQSVSISNSSDTTCNTANSSSDLLAVTNSTCLNYSDTTTSGAEKLCGSMTKQTSQRNFENVTKRDRRRSEMLPTQQEYDIWCKAARKLLESSLRKAILNTSIQQKRMPCQNRSNEQQKQLQTNSPRGNSSLKRSNDIKLSLSKMLDKKCLDILLQISGPDIRNNTINADEHGVVKVCDYESQGGLPVWVIRTMHTVLNWEKDKPVEDDLPSFMDVYDKIIEYFHSLQEPILTKELSYLFIQILDMLLINPNKKTDGRVKEEIESSLGTRLDSELNRAAVMYQTVSNTDSERVEMLRELILDSIVPSPHCCYDCLQKYEIHSQELSLLSESELMDAWLEINSNRYDDETPLEDYVVIDEPVDNEEAEFELYKVRKDRESDLISFSSIFFPATITQHRIEPPAPPRTLTKSLSDKKIRRNNSFRAAIGSYTTTSPTFVDNMPTIHQGKTSPLSYTRNPKFKSNFNRKQTPGRPVTKSFVEKLKENKIGENDDDNDESVFKKPMQPSDTLPKSISMNFNMNETMTDNRKRKANNMVNSSSSESLNSFAHRHVQLKSMSSMNITKDLENQLPSISLNHLNYWANKQQIINDLIKSTKSWNDLNSKRDDNYDDEPEEIAVITLQTKINKDLLTLITDIFRLLASMLPSANKRTLHFLLRFLHKFKISKKVRRSYLDCLNDVNYIDSSIGSSKQAAGSPSHCSSKEIEQKLIETFWSSIVRLDDDSALTRQLSKKLVQILIDNYEEIMKPPDDLAQSVKNKLDRAASREEAAKLEMKSNQAHLAILLEDIIKDVNMSEREKSARLKQLKDAYPSIFEENVRFKKALNVLGLNETISATTSTDLTSSSDCKSNAESSDSSRKKVFLTNLTNSIKSRHLSSTLNHTVINSSSSSTNSHSKSTLGIQRLFVKKKKENLI